MQIMALGIGYGMDGDSQSSKTYGSVTGVAGYQNAMKTQTPPQYTSIYNGISWAHLRIRTILYAKEFC